MSGKVPMLALCCAGGALALGDAARGQDLETLVVRASRTPVAVDAAGSSVTVITREQIERRQAVFVADLLRSVPGIAVSRSGSFGDQTQIRVRGAEANHALVFIDGVEANDPAIGDEFQFEHLLAADIERIEIVRGPQSALWGSDAVGGVIHIETRRAGGTPRRELSVESGSFGTARAGARAGFGAEDSRVSLGASWLDTDGTNVSRAGSENDGYRNAALNVNAHVEPREGIGLDLVARRVDATNQFDATDFVTGLPADSDRESDSTKSYAAATASFDGGARWSHRVGLDFLDTRNENAADGAPAGSTAAEKAGLSVQSSLAPPDAPHLFTFALEHESERFVQRGAASAFGDPNQQQRLATTGYVFEYRSRLGRALNLSASARYDTSSDFDSVATYRVTTSYALGELTRVRASYGTGQKSPTFVERFGFFPDLFLGNPDLEPERSNGWEIGFDRTLGGGRVTLDAVYFDTRLEDEIDGFAFDAGSGQFTAVNEAGRSRRRGVETTISARLTDAVELTGSYAYLDATEPDGTGAQTREVRRPRHSGALNLSYAISTRASLNVDVAYTGARYDTFFPPTGAAQRRELGSYRLVTLAGRVGVTDRIELFGRIENLLDEEYEDVLGFATAGRGAYIGFRADLNGRGGR